MGAKSLMVNYTRLSARSGTEGNEEVGLACQILEQ
jgi:hypothetical protein